MRLRLTVAYDGRAFHGVTPQTQEGVDTVGGALMEALRKVLRVPVPPRLSVAGRTDTGVHGWGQVVSFDAPVAGLRGPNAVAGLRGPNAAEGLDLDRIVRSVNSQLAPRVVVRDLAVAPPDFSARHSAKARRYRYTILNRLAPDPFLDATTWHVADPLDLSALRLACDPLIGEHDFSSFCREPKGVPSFSMVRRVYDARWSRVGDGNRTDPADLLRFEIEASSFCQQMVRAVVGTMVEMGLGKRAAGEMASILRARRRAAAGRIAPAHGLCLWEVRY